MATQINWANHISNLSVLGSTAQEQAQHFAWVVKAFIRGQVGTGTGGAWTCLGSSDGATAGMDGVDRWGSTFDASKIVFSLSSAFSWIVLQSPFSDNGSPLKLILSLRKGTSNPAEEWRGFTLHTTVGNVTGGSTTAIPSFTKATFHGDGGSDGKRGGVFISNIFGGRKINATRSDTGEFTITGSRSSTARATFIMFVRLAVGGQAPFKSRVFTCHNDNNNYGDAGTTGSNRVLLWYDQDNTLASPQSTSGGAGYFYSGVQSPTDKTQDNEGYFSVFKMVLGFGAYFNMFEAGVAYDPYSPRNRIYPAPDDTGNYPMGELELASQFKRTAGIIPDMFWCSEKVPDFTSTPLTGTPEYFNVGAFWIPSPPTAATY